MRPIRLVLLFLAAIAFAGFPAFGAKHTVGMDNFQFVPPTLQVSVGDSVAWVNNEQPQVLHTVTSGSSCIANGLFDSGNMVYGDVFTFRFLSAGTFPYYCIPHCSIGMVGEVSVNPVATESRTWGKIKNLYR